MKQDRVFLFPTSARGPIGAFRLLHLPAGWIALTGEGAWGSPDLSLWTLCARLMQRPLVGDEEDAPPRMFVAGGWIFLCGRGHALRSRDGRDWIPMLDEATTVRWSHMESKEIVWRGIWHDGSQWTLWGSAFVCNPRIGVEDDPIYDSWFYSGVVLRGPDLHHLELFRDLHEDFPDGSVLGMCMRRRELLALIVGEPPRSGWARIASLGEEDWELLPESDNGVLGFSTRETKINQARNWVRLANLGGRIVARGSSLFEVQDSGSFWNMCPDIVPSSFEYVTRHEVGGNTLFLYHGSFLRGSWDLARWSVLDERADYGSAYVLEGDILTALADDGTVLQGRLPIASIIAS